MRTGSIASLAVVAVVAVASPASAESSVQPAGSCRPAWALAATPAIPGSQGVSSGNTAQVDSVSALHGGGAWFAGEVDSPVLRPWVLRWEGHAVRAAMQIPQSPLDAQTGGPGSLGRAHDGWMLASNFGAAPAGMGGQGDGDEPPYAEHWQHGQWTMTPLAVSPHPRTTGTQALGIAAVSPVSAWAVGMFYEARPGVTVGTVPTGALIEHWNGTSWQLVANPAEARPGGELSALTVVSAADIWAVGLQRSSGGMVVPLVLHWNGRSWAGIPAPAAAAPAGFLAVSADGGKDIWAAGAQTKPGTGDVAIPLAEHWDGRSWTVARLPSVGNALLTSVYAGSAADVWATVERPSGNRAIFMHFGGRSWQTVAAPGPQEYGLIYTYLGIDGTGPRSIWAVGSVTADYSQNTTPLVARLHCG